MVAVKNPLYFLSANAKKIMDLCERLVEEVQKRPALFDKANDNYCNRVYLNKQWREIGENLDLDGQAARKKWTGLRDYFTRAHRKMTSLKSGSAPEKRRKWYLYDQMLFLLPYLSENKTCSNLSDVSDQEKETADQSEGGESLPSINDDVIETPTIDTLESSSVDKGKRKRLKFPQERALASTTDKEIFTAIKNISGTASRSGPEDEDELFFKSLIPKMKCLDTVTKWELQAEIQMLVLRYVKASGRHSTNFRHDTVPSASPSLRPPREPSASP